MSQIADMDKLIAASEQKNGSTVTYQQSSGGSNSLNAEVRELKDGTFIIKTDDNTYELPYGDYEKLVINGKKATPNQKSGRVGGGISLKHAIKSTIAEHNLELDTEYQQIKENDKNEKFNEALDFITSEPTIMFKVAGKDGNVWVESKIKINGDEVGITPLVKGIVQEKSYSYPKEVINSEWKDRFETVSQTKENEYENAYYNPQNNPNFVENKENGSTAKTRLDNSRAMGDKPQHLPLGTGETWSRISSTVTASNSAGSLRTNYKAEDSKNWNQEE
jgi:hypothetical protein